MPNNDDKEKDLLNAGIETMVNYKRRLLSFEVASKQLTAQSGLDIEVARDLLASMSKHNVMAFPDKPD